MKTAIFLSFLLAASAASAAKPAPAPKADAKAQQAAFQTRLKRLISHVLKTGEDTTSAVATVYGLTDGPAIKAKKLEKRSADKRTHSFTVAYQDSGGIQVVKLDLSCDESTATVWYFATTTGALEKANALVAGKPRELDPRDPQLLKLFTAELQYHLKPGVWLD